MGRFSKGRVDLGTTVDALAVQQDLQSRVDRWWGLSFTQSCDNRSPCSQHPGSWQKAGLSWPPVAQHLSRKQLVVEKALQAFENLLLSLGSKS